MFEVVKIFCLLCVLAPAMTLGQVATISPYSRYGIGETDIVLFSQSTGMGGESFSLSNPEYLNFANPASAGFNRPQTMLFETGFVNKFQRIDYSKTDTIRYNHIYLSHIVFGFPIVKWWKCSFGIIPFSRMNYRYTATRTFPDIGNVSYSYSGNGEVDRVFLNNSIRIRNLSIGISCSYLFGTLNYASNSYLESPVPASIYALSKSDELAVSDIRLNYGLSYKTKFNDLEISAGAVYTPESDVKTLYRSYAVNVDKTFFTNNSVLYLKDTVSSFTTKENIVLPEKAGFGIAIAKNRQWLIKTDFAIEKWSQFRSPVYIYDMADSRSFSTGFQWIPDIDAVRNFLKTTRYRFGIFSRETPLVFHGVRIMNHGISFGIGIPLKRSQSTLNLGVETGTIGTNRKNLVKEDYIRFSFSLTLNDIWFIKRKIE